jgi:poly-gamma-glutamate synthesis protein (capsule biosynthesis protein)
MKAINRFFVVLSCIMSSFAWSQKDTSALQFLFVGDVMQHGGQLAGAYIPALDSYDYRDCFQFVKPIIQEADIAIANLEVTHAGKPYKGYPQFSAPPELSEALVDAGFNVIITANNHSCDGGARGVVKTLDALDKIGVKHTGTFRNKAERDVNYPLIIEEKGIKVAILNYTYGTNGLSVAPPLIINYIDSATMKADFKKAKALGAEWIICTLHWGTEYQSLPNAYQKNWEKFCYDHGADMVIGSHPHVIQPVVEKTIKGKQKLTAYSLGNFVSNQRDRYKNGGLILSAFVSEKENGVQLDSARHTFAYVHPRPEVHNKPYYILPEFYYSKYRADFMDGDAYRLYQEFFSDSRALFAEHAAGSKEYLIDSDTLIISYYAKLLSGYYSLEVPKEIVADPSLLSPRVKHLMHKVLGADGQYHWVLGYYSSEEEARRKVIYEVEISEPKPVFISPTTYKVL